MSSTLGPKAPRTDWSPVTTGKALKMAVVFLDCIQARRAAVSEEEFPHPRLVAVSNHALLADAFEFGKPHENTVPDSEMKPAAIGSDFQAYE